MKNFITSILLLFALGINAQNINVDITGVVSDVNGDPIEGIYVTAYADDVFGNYYTSFTDSLGVYSFEIEEALPYGCAFVIFMDCNFDIFEEVVCWEEESDDFELDWTYCEAGSTDSICYVNFYEEQIDLGTSQLIAIPSGEAPFEYFWSTGEIGPSIIVNSEGDYCVTLTTGNGCATTECYYFWVPSPCESYIYQDWLWNEVLLGADSNGEPPFTYLWSTGETETNIIVDETGEYCVTVLDANGCEDVTCDWVEIFIDSTNCFSWIYEELDGNGNINLVVEAQGFGPFTYLWETGETTSSIPLDSSLTYYCVTVFDSIGCTSTSCYEFYGPCGVSISCDPVPNGIWLFSNAWGEWPLEYNWSTGETTETIQIFEEGEYCLTITDATGCTSETCFEADPTMNPFDSLCVVFIYEEFLPNQTGVELFVETFGLEVLEYQWSTGENSPSILVNEEGEYCLEVVYENGCVAGECYYYFKPEDCGLSVSCDPTEEGAEFLAFPWGVEPFEYLWSTGETTEFISVVEEGEYCVTITDATGCEADYCAYFDPTMSNQDCEVVIDAVFDSTMVFLTANSFGVGPFFYEWSTGESTQTIEVTVTGEYCVLVFDDLGCFSEACFFVDTQDNTGPTGPTNTVFGFVFTNGENVDSEVKLYRVNENEIELVDSMWTEDVVGLGLLGYQFTDLVEGEYLVKAVPDSEAFVPTYHESSLLWEDAQSIEITSSGFVQADIFLINAQTGFGPGVINGNITLDGLWSGNTGSSDRNEKPAVGLTILLFNENNVPINHAITDENGSFRFNDLALGRYKLMTEDPGAPHHVEWVTLTEEDPIVDVQLELENPIVFTSTTDIENGIAFSLAPNPATEFIRLMSTEFDQELNQLEIINVLGHKVLVENISKSEIKDGHQLDISNLEIGHYYLRIVGERTTFVQAFNKI